MTDDTKAPFGIVVKNTSITPKAFYQNYLADDSLAALNIELCELVAAEKPISVFELGCGTGKNLKYLNAIYPVVTCGLDISMQNIVTAYYKNDLPFVIKGDEYHLGFLQGFSVAFTCSVLDHIEDIEAIISELKRMANTIFLAETNDKLGQFYYPHDYESYGFDKLEFTWIGQDGGTYYIWKWKK